MNPLRLVAATIAVSAIAVAMASPAAAPSNVVTAPVTVQLAASTTPALPAYPWDIPHRGAGAAPYGYNPESTSTAYAYAVDTLKLPFVDVDVWLTKDHWIAVHHDATMHDTNCGSKKISSLTAAQFKACRYTNGGTHPLVLSQLFNTYGKSVVYTPEIKNLNDKSGAYLLSGIRKFGMQSRTFVQASTLTALKPFVTAGIGTVLGSVSSDKVADDGRHWVGQMRKAGVKYISMSKACDDTHIRHYTAAGIHVLMWTIDTRADYLRLNKIRPAVAGYFSNDPRVLQ